MRKALERVEYIVHNMPVGFLVVEIRVVQFTEYESILHASDLTRCPICTID
jgi:hypothetical protein